MQLSVSIQLDEPLSLPINYNHIVQSIIYRALRVVPEYADFLHTDGFILDKRQYKMFQFSQLTGDYVIRDKWIIFQSYVEFEIRSVEPMFLRILGESFWNNGITFGDKVYRNLQMDLYDYTVEETELMIRMKSPVTVYSTDKESGKTYYYNPLEETFYDKINETFYRKYEAYYGIPPASPINLSNGKSSCPKRLVTRYQGSYITAFAVKESILISCIRQVWEVKIRKALECLKFCEMKGKGRCLKRRHFSL